MDRSGVSLIRVVAALAFLAAIPCCQAPQPRFTHQTSTSTKEVISLSSFLCGGSTGTETFLQKPQGRRSAAKEYGRRSFPQGRVEGHLLDRIQWPLDQYIDRASNRPDRPRIPWPTGAERAVEAFLIEFDEPVTEWPEHIQEGEIHHQASGMRAYDRWGIPFSRGSLSRTIWLHGTEEACGSGSKYRDCVRLESVTDLRFGWWAHVALQESVWFARSVGPVRRIERFSGSALLVFRFRSVTDYELSRHSTDSSPSDQADALSGAPRRWVRLAVSLVKGIPRPRLGGIAVEWSDMESPQRD